ncbi:hypothetical protein VNI00_017022 [Paramarasmius palmivorus]|uniref:Uncharacterized protein n=1 Tax=Paramarasmius palmivorus TaxID=297713 RepID=A0AAW0B9R3_9AGAR
MAWNSFDQRSLREYIVETVRALDSWRVSGGPGQNEGTPLHPGFTPLNHGELIFSLSSTTPRLENYGDMRSYLEAYISDQYNALLDNIISADSSYNNWNNTKEMDIKERLSISYTLFAGIGMPEIIGANNTSSVDDSPFTHSGPAAGAIAGGSVGGLILVVLSILVWVLYNRRRRRDQSEQSKNTDPEPFAL